MIWLVLAFVVVAAIGTWLARSRALDTPLMSDATVDADGRDLLESAATEAPGLQMRARRVPTGREPAPQPMEVRDTDWVIEISEVVRADGKSAVGTNVTLEIPASAGFIVTSGTWVFTWEGEPLQIRLRWEDPAAGARGDTRDLPGYRSGEAILLSLWGPDCAPWFSSGLVCPAGRSSHVSARLEKPRTLSGRVFAQGGDGPPHSETKVWMTMPGISAAVYSVDADVDATGRFAFNSDEVPGGRFLLTVRAVDRGEEGCPSTVEVGPGEDDISITLLRSHRFTFHLDFAEEVRTERFGVRRVDFGAVEGSAGEDEQHTNWYAVDSASRRSPLAALYEPLLVVLPEGPDERWRIVVPGYRPAEEILRPSGEERVHDVPVRLAPEVNSGLLVVDVGFVGGARTASVSGNIEMGAGEHEESTHWILPYWEGPGHLRAAIRLPSGQPISARLSAQLLEAQSAVSWGISPFLVTLAAGQIREHKASIAQTGKLVVLRKRDPKAKLRPRLRLRLTQGGVGVVRGGWDAGRIGGGGLAYRLTAVLPPGRCLVELLRDDTLLDWSEVVQIESGKTTRVDLPQVEKLK